MGAMRLAVVFIFGLFLSSALGSQDDDGLGTELWKRSEYKWGPGLPKIPPPNVDIPPTVLISDGLVAPLFRVNTRGSSIPHFVVELFVGYPPTPLNFTIDTMGRETSLPSEFCSNAATPPYNPHTFSFITGNNNNGNGNNKDKEKNGSPPAPGSGVGGKEKVASPPSPGSGDGEKGNGDKGKEIASPPSPVGGGDGDKGKEKKGSPPSPGSGDVDKGKEKIASPPSPGSDDGDDDESPPPGSPPASPSQMSYIVPCNHKVCQGATFTCDKMRKRCMGFDRMTGKPVDLVLTQITMPRVDATGKATGDTQTVRGLVMGCSPSDSATASLAPTAMSLTSQLSSAAGMPRRFAYCLGKPRGAFFVGGADHVFRQRDFKPSMQYLPMLTPPSEWQRGLGYRLALQGIAVGIGPAVRPLPIDPFLFDRGVVIGTRNRYTSLVDPAYQVVRRYFSRMASLTNSSLVIPVPSPFPELNLCYRIPEGVPVTGAPKIQFIFDNATLTVEPRNYIVRWRRTEIVCLGIVSSGPLGRISVIGTLQQEETLIEVDMDKNVVGVSEPLTLSGNSCSNFAFLPEKKSKRSSAMAPAPASMQSLEDDFVSIIDEELEAAADSSFDVAVPPAY